MGFRSDTRQLPIAQLGCAPGGAAINRAHDFCAAHPGSNVLIVSCEFCSLCYQPTDVDIGSLLSAGLFGDAVVRGRGGRGLGLERNASYLIPHTEDWISYDVKGDRVPLPARQARTDHHGTARPGPVRPRRRARLERLPPRLLHHPRRRSSDP